MSPRFDTVPLADLALSSARLMNDDRWPWIILVPRRAEITELHALDEAKA